MDVLAVSDFLRDLFLILLVTPFILLWGSVAAREPTKHDGDEQYLAELALRQERARQPVGGLGLGPS